MIDVENQIFTAVKTAIGTNATVLPESVRRPAEFPCVTVEEISNTEEVDKRPYDLSQEFARVQYRVQVFTNDINGKKARAKELFKTVDTVLRNLGFRREVYLPRPELYESSIYDIRATYSAVIDHNEVIYTDDK